jgi:hypothetical protein
MEGKNGSHFKRFRNENLRLLAFQCVSLPIHLSCKNSRIVVRILMKIDIEQIN